MIARMRNGPVLDPAAVPRIIGPYFDHRGSVVGSIGIYGPSAPVNDAHRGSWAEDIELLGSRGQVEPPDERSATRGSPGRRN